MQNITVVTVSYNCIQDIEKTFLSVFNQTYPNIEYIVIDGASTDGTVDAIRRYASRLSYWISEPDSGIYDAMNKGIKMATGEYIIFINAGDTFHTSESIAAIFATPTTADIVYGDILIISRFYNFIVKARPLNKITQGMVFGHPASFVRTEIHKKMNFNTSFRIAGDYDFFLRAYKEGATFEYREIIVANFDAVGGISNTNIKLSEQERARIQGKDKNIYWRIKFHLWMMPLYYFKQKIKDIFPQWLVKKIYILKLNLSKNIFYKLK